MPDIQLIPWGSERAVPEGTIKLLILSYMLFPNDEEKRRGWLALLGSQAREDWRKAPPEKVSWWIADRAVLGGDALLPPPRIEAARDRLKEGVTVDFQDFFGGADAMGLLPPKAKLLQETREGRQKWLRVGIIFRLLVDFHYYYNQQRFSFSDVFPLLVKHPSLEPLIVGIARNERLLPKDDPFRDRILYGLWEEHKRVAHFCAAFSCLAVEDYCHCLRWKKAGIEPFTARHRSIALSQFLAPSEAAAPLNFLGLALAFQRFGQSYRSKQSSHALIPANAWTIPEKWDLPRLDPPNNIPPHSFRHIFESHARTLAA
jgi:hypothetical protein